MITFACDFVFCFPMIRTLYDIILTLIIFLVICVHDLFYMYLGQIKLVLSVVFDVLEVVREEG